MHGLRSGECCLILGSDSAGHGNKDAQYTMGGTVLNITVKEKYLGLIMCGLAGLIRCTH